MELKATSKILMVLVSPVKIHIASPYLFYNLGFECVFYLHRHKDKLDFYFNIGTLYTMFIDGHFLDFFSR